MNLNQLLAIWTWFNGKKTAIAALLTIFAAFISQFVVGIWHFNPVWMAQVLDSINYFAVTLGTVGVVHKVAKGDFSPAPAAKGS